MGILAATLLLFMLSLALRWPGVAMYDSVTQYEQALIADYSDWHPPIMARLWALLLHVWPGTAPFFLLQMALWWGGFGLLGAALARGGRRGAGILILLIGAFPLFLGWGTVVLKDAQMAACLVMATGLVGWWRLAERPVPVWAILIAAVLIGYATLVRGNAVFATVPLALALSGWGGARRLWLRAGIALAGIALVLGASPLVNHRLFRAEAEHNDRSLPLWDIVAIAHRAGTVPPGIAPPDWARAESRDCYTPFFWNPYGEPEQCDAIGQALAFADGPHPELMRIWVRSVLHHPFAYAAHRLAHFNMTLRFWVGAGERDAIPPVASEPNPDALGGPANTGGRTLVQLATVTNATPLGWPVVWLASAAALVWGLRHTSGPEAALARALALSALAMSGSFLLASIASDLRYHLWSMIAAALALVLGLPRVTSVDRRLCAGITLAVALVGLLARVVAPMPYVPLPPKVPTPTIAR